MKLYRGWWRCKFEPYLRAVHHALLTVAGVVGDPIPVTLKSTAP